MKKTLVFIASVLVAAQFAVAGSFNVTGKQPTQNYFHENFGIATTTEADFCIILGESDSFGDGSGSGINSLYSVDLGALVGGGSVEITDIGWDVTIDPIGASWYSEANFGFATDSGGVSLAPGAGDDEANDGAPRTYVAPPVNLIDAGVGNLVATDGLLNLELFESFDDVTGEVDSNLLAPSSLTLLFNDANGGTHTAELKWQAVPEPASISLLLISMLGLLGFRRK